MENAHLWRIVAAYLADYQDIIPVELKSKIEGASRARDLSTLMSLTDVRWSDYQDHSLPFVLMQIRALFSKNAAFASNTCESTAFAAFKRGERICRLTNKRFQYHTLYPERMTDRVLFFNKVRGIIGRVLGSHRDFLDSIPTAVRLTSGASEHLPRARSFPFNKIKGGFRAPGLAYPLCQALSISLDVEMRFVPVSNNRVTFVPKNYKTHRTIACEPSGLAPFQLAFDTFIKKRLGRLNGIDLSNQTRNFDLARKGSVDDSLATIDLSMASDTLSYEVVKYVVPPEWWNVLKRLRSPLWSVKTDGVTHNGAYSKFSSMGNGVTFGLETLLFAAICAACGSDVYSVYGDDIIVESELANDVIEKLRWFGFMPNIEKTYTSGPFRESCGGFFFNGIDVTPYYQKTGLSHRAEVHLLCNSLFTRSKPYGEVWCYLRRLIEEYKCHFGPPTLDLTTHIHLDAHTCYINGLIRHNLPGREHIPCFKGTARVGKSFRPRSSRHWFIYSTITVSRVGVLPTLDSVGLDGLPSILPYVCVSAKPDDPYDFTSIQELDFGVVKLRDRWISYIPVGPKAIAQELYCLGTFLRES